MLEGMQIAFFAVSKITEEERKQSPWAARTCELLFDEKGHNLPGFMVGRQLCVVSCFFVAARATTMDIEDGESNILDVPDGVQAFFDTGLLGAFITTIVASIAWQLVASAFPMAMLSTPITYVLLRICLFLEATGICQGAWVLAAIHKKAAGFQKDEVYVGTAEERAAMTKGENASGFKTDVGHLTGSAYPATGAMKLPAYLEEDYTQKRAVVLENIKVLREQISVAETGEQKAIFEKSLTLEMSTLKKINAASGGDEEATK